MKTFHEVVLRCSSSLRAYLALALAFGVLLALLRQISAAFAAATSGITPFDLQNDLRVAGALAQLPSYTDASRRLYWVFTGVDFAFPVVGGALSAASFAFLLRRAWPPAYEAVEENRAFGVFLVPALFDWMENAASIALIASFPPPSSGLATLLVMAKTMKLATLYLSQGVVALVGLAWLSRRSFTLFRERVGRSER